MDMELESNRKEEYALKDRTNVLAHFFFTKFVNIIYYHYLCA